MTMLKHLWALAAATLLLAGSAQAQVTDDFATGNMHFDVKAMDTNHDGMISHDEMKAYGEKMWSAMAKDAPTIPVVQAAQDFARGNVNFNAKAMDTDHDGTISKDEFMTYAEHKFDKMKKDSHGMVSVADASAAFARGNPAAKAASDTSK
jgi:Ca2+-binding EF-hand superfamily protein